MISISENLTVINGMTESNWREELKEAMEQRNTVLFLSSEMSEGQLEEVERLCREQQYRSPDPVSEEQWATLRERLNLNSQFTSKEQGINRNYVYLTAPDTGERK